MSASAQAPDRILQRLEWTVLRRLDGVLHGDYRTLFRGFGLDLADLREYQYHDDVRHIDWNVTARLQVPYVREYNEDRDVTAWFLLDLSPSVDFGSGTSTKRQVSAEFVAAGRIGRGDADEGHLGGEGAAGVVHGPARGIRQRPRDDRRRQLVPDDPAVSREGALDDHRPDLRLPRGAGVSTRRRAWPSPSRSRHIRCGPW